MATFPQSFVKEMRPLPADLGFEDANTAAKELFERGWVVETGMTPEFAGAIGKMAMQPHIREYCPKDAKGSRFTPAWMEDSGGRGGFGIRPVDGQWAGYGWTGPGECEELPNCSITFAVRLGEAGLKKGLAVPFGRLIVAGTAACYGIRREQIGLETWKSNAAAVSAYDRVGFSYITQKIGEFRPTLKPLGTEIGEHVVFAGEYKGEPANMVEDTRLFMEYRG